MIEEYIRHYEEAIRKKDRKTQQKIERDLARVGMDRMTLLTIVMERNGVHGSKVQPE